MKYLKTFEDKKYEFKIGDYVKICKKEFEGEIFVIHNIEPQFIASPYVLRNIKQDQTKPYIETPLISNIKRLKDYEIDAIKYNL